MTAAAEAEDLPLLLPGTFETAGPDGAIRLIGRACADCGTRSFPARERCVACYGGNLGPAALERVGKVDAFTIIRQAPPGYHGPVPYVLAMVIVGNDVHVLAHLVGRPVDGWRRGETVAACALALPAGPERREHLAYAFRPATADDLDEL
jgi:uncharacterized protein